MEAARPWILGAVLILSGLSSLAITAGTAYVVFWMGYSGWWWVLTALLLQGGCVSVYRIMNAILFDEPAYTLGMETT